MGILLSSVNVKVVLAFLECLSENGVSPNMLCNYVSAIKAKFVIYDFPAKGLESKRIYNYAKSHKINRPLNIISIGDIGVTLSVLKTFFPGFTL